MYITTPDGKNHYIFDTTKDIPDILRQYVCEEVAEYVGDILKEDEQEINFLRDELDFGTAAKEVKDMLTDIKAIADNLLAMKRVDRKTLDYNMKRISDMIYRRL